MSAILSHGGFVALEAREWRDTVGQSGMTPTAFSFLIPVFVVAIAAPFLCIFCIRKRRQVVPTAARPLPKAKKPALRRAEARERLLEVTEISTVGTSSHGGGDGGSVKPEAETRSVLERECAICLSTLYAPAPPEPAKLSPDAPITDEAALPASMPDPTAASSEAEAEADKILKLRVCGHEFHAECLVSWFVLRKTSCPICRSSYMSKEAMDEHDEEERIALGGAAEPTAANVAVQTPTPAAPVVSNWRYFLHGQNVVRNQQRSDIEMNVRTGGEGDQQTQGGATTAPPQQEQSRRSRLSTLWRSGAT